MFALEPRNWVIAACAAVATLAAAPALTPSRTTVAAPVPQSPPLPPLPSATPALVTLVVLPRRDPFVDESRTAKHVQRSTSDIAAPPPLPPVPARLAPLPPNAGAGSDEPFLPARVTAILTGTPPYAVVEELGHSRLVTVGDLLDGVRIEAVNARGVHLAAGTTLPLAPSSPSGSSSNATSEPRGSAGLSVRPLPSVPPAVPSISPPGGHS